MGIDVPDLDDREFEDVFEEMRRQIPVHTDEWSDHNAHDTGIAILEMLTWVADTYTYQLDQITDTHREKYLSLLGVERRPPTPASTRVSLTLPEGLTALGIAAGEQFVVDDRSGTDKTFETVRDRTITAATIESVITVSGDDTVDNTTENEMDETQFLAFGDEPTAGDAIYLGFSQDPFEGTETLDITVSLADEELPAPATSEYVENDFNPSAAVSWEYCTAYQDWQDDGAWEPLTVRRDGTNAFYRDGVVSIDDPDWDVDAVGRHEEAVHGQSPGLVWIRCRVETADYEFPPQINVIDSNAVEVRHRATVTDEVLKRADERTETTIETNQEFFFEHAPVLEADIVVGDIHWTAVDDFDTSGPADTHYILDPSRGSITFGDGRHGTKPPVGEEVRAKRYVYGGGPEGNVPKRSAWEFQRSEEQLTDSHTLEDVAVTPLQRGSGGRGEESIEAAMDRFKRDLKRPYRAVTKADYEYLATHTPGLRFGRAKAVSTTIARHGTERTSVTVVVVPYSTNPRPEPSAAFLDAVQSHLDRSRLLTDSVVVTGPTYVTVGIDLVVSVIPGRTERRVCRSIRQTLIDYVHPIDGFDGEGWPFGRSLYVSDLATVVGGVSGVQSVVDLTISTGAGGTIDEHGNVHIDEYALPSLIERELSITTTDGVGIPGGER